MNEACQSLTCQNRIEPVSRDNGKSAWRRVPRRFCSPKCRLNHWALTRAAKILSPFQPVEAAKMLRQALRQEANDRDE